jgi:hypothetical protein
MDYWCRNVTGDWVWSSDEEDAEEDADKNKSKKMSKTPKEVRNLIPWIMFLGLLNPHPDPYIICSDPGPYPYVKKQKNEEKPWFLLFVTS